MQAIRDEANRLLSLGYDVIPLHGVRSDGSCTCNRADCGAAGKHPRISQFVAQPLSGAVTRKSAQGKVVTQGVAWTDWSHEELVAIIQSWPWDGPVNIGLRPGRTFVILDFDGGEGADLLQGIFNWCPALINPDTGAPLYPFFRTANGFHLLGRGTAETSKVRVLDGLDVRGAGAQAVIPPSLHASGRLYEVLLNPLTVPPEELPMLPQALLDLANGGPVPNALRPPDWKAKERIPEDSKFDRSDIFDEVASARIRGVFPGRADTITDDDLLWHAEYQSDSDSGKLTAAQKSAAFRALAAGGAYAPPGLRNTMMNALVGYLAEYHFETPLERVLEIFDRSRLVMEAQGASSTNGPVPSHAEISACWGKYTRDKKSREAEKAEKPEILVTLDERRVLSDTLDALGRIEPPPLFSRGGRLCYVQYSDSIPNVGTLAQEAPVIQIAPTSYIQHVLNSYINWVGYKPVRQTSKAVAEGRKPEFRQSKMKAPKNLAVLLSEVGEIGTSKIPRLQAVVEGPFLRTGGSLCRGGFFDRASGVYSTGASSNRSILPLQEACGILADVFVDFPLEQGHYSILLAAVLTGVGRFTFTGPSPLFLFDANQPAAGKTLAAHVVANIVTPEGAVSATLGSGKEDGEEDRKQLTSVAVAGARVVLIDNVTGIFGSNKLCEALTLHNGMWSDRLLGRNTTWRGPLNPLWLATGNNVLLRADMYRRVCYCRLNSKTEKPEERTGFRHPALMTYVREKRLDLFWAALSILKNYFDAGCPFPEGLAHFGGFEDWSAKIRGAVIWAGYPDPLGTKESLSSVDEDRENGSIVVQSVLRMCTEQEKNLKASEILDIAYGGLGDDYSQFLEILKSQARYVKGERIPAGSLGKILKRYRERPFDGYYLYFDRREWGVRKVEEEES